MFEALFGLVRVAIMIGVGLFAFSLARQYVRNRLRFVDSVRTPLPLVTGLTAIVFGAATGLGTASGVKALKRGE